jgi:hypothetical protein
MVDAEHLEYFHQLANQRKLTNAKLNEINKEYEPLRNKLREAFDLGTHKEQGFLIEVTKGSTTKIDMNKVKALLTEEQIESCKVKYSWKNIKVSRL